MTKLRDDLPSLYDITGKITDCNTLLINRDVLRQLESELEDSYKEKQKCYFAVGQYQKATDNLIKERDSYKADAEILDWLESSTESHGFCHTGYDGYRYYARQREGYRTVRQVLTTAMKGQP